MKKEKYRAGFEKYYGKIFDLTMHKDEWSKERRYVHPYVQSIWMGWRDALTQLDSEDAAMAGAIMMSAQVNDQH